MRLLEETEMNFIIAGRLTQLPVVHPIVNKRVDHSIGHCQPIEGKVHVLHVATGCHGVVVVSIDVETMIRQPAQREDSHYHYEHPNNLKTSFYVQSNVFITSNRVSRGYIVEI